MNEEQIKTLLSQAFAACLGSAAALLTVWKGSLSAKRATRLAEFEKRGLRVGVSISMPRDRWMLQVFVLDPNSNETEVLDSIEQAGAPPSVN